MLLCKIPVSGAETDKLFRAAFATPDESKEFERAKSIRNHLIRKLDPLMRSALSPDILKNRAAVIVCVVALFLAVLPSATAQQPDFTLTVISPGFNPPALNPGGQSQASLSLDAQNGFTGSVNLTCQVTPAQTTDPCKVSQSSVFPPGGATATFNAGSLPVGAYTVTITGTAASNPSLTHSAQETLSIQPVAPGYTITVANAVAPSSVPAGNGAQGKVTITPLNGYSDSGTQVTLSCATITPLVTNPPVCSFANPVHMSGVPQTVGISIATAGPTTTGANTGTRRLYALWLPLPLLALAGFGALTGRNGRRTAWGLFAIVVLGASLLFVPACANTSTTSTTTPNGTTPNNFYTFTIVGVDNNGLVSSNASSTSNPSVTLTVTSPTN